MSASSRHLRLARPPAHSAEDVTRRPSRGKRTRDADSTAPDPRTGAADPELAPSLQHALRLPGCPVCRVVRDAEPQYWRSLGERHARGAAIEAVCEAVGYCPRHLAQLQERGDPSMTAEVARAAVEGALSALRAPRCRRLRPDGGSDSASRPGERCPACAALAPLEHAAIDLLARLIVDDHRARRLLELGNGLWPLLRSPHLGAHASLAGRSPAPRARRDPARRRAVRADEVSLQPRRRLRTALGTRGSRPGASVPIVA